jgi:Concanavalin A-like lectin/glucanases superfamily
MSSREKIDSVYDFTDKGLVELKAWLEPWFLRDGAGAFEWEDVGLACGETLTYVQQVLTHPDLVHYWRMGETGDQPDLAPGYTPVDLQHVAATGSITVPGTFDVVGALSPAQDDGAWQSNLDGCNYSGGAHGDVFTTVSAHRATFAGNTPLTVELWLWPSIASGTGHGGIITVSDSANNTWSLNMVYPSYKLYFSRGSAGGTITTAGLVTETWQYLVVTYDGTTTRFYLNGAVWFEVADSSSIPSLGQPIRVALSATAADCFFGGKMDEIALYTACLSAEEIAAHYLAASA